MSDWQQPPENSLASLVHGITHCDGIELDLRLTSDNELVIHHDAKVSIAKHLLDSDNQYVEGWELDDLQNHGFCSFRQLIANQIIQKNWRDEGKMVCLELKRPHPKSPIGGGYFNQKRVTESLCKMIDNASLLLDEFEIPKSNIVFYAFHNKIHQSIKTSNCKYNWAELLPVVPRFGYGRFKRLMAYPQYLVTPFSKLINKHKQRGASMVPCAIEYFQPFYNRLLIGRSVGLSGKRLDYFQNCRNAMPVYVWPAKKNYEARLLDSGITGLTDNLDPEFTWYKDGKPRWRFPATQPLDIEQQKRLNNANFANHRDILKELYSEVPKWSECDLQRKQTIIQSWRDRWNWDFNTEDMKANLDYAPPWKAVRLIGHRGAGKSPRPVMH